MAPACSSISTAHTTTMVAMIPASSASAAAVSAAIRATTPTASGFAPFRPKVLVIRGPVVAHPGYRAFTSSAILASTC